jgi:hypothetical protein
MATTPPPKLEIAQRFAEDRLRYPGMLPLEIAIFKAWFARRAADYTDGEFNVRVGKGFDPGPAYGENERKAAIYSTQKRIDALLWQGPQPTILEVKYRASLLIIGQLVSYQILWMQANPGSLRPKLYAITNQTDDDSDYVMDVLGITHDIVPADLSAFKPKST